MYTAYHLTESKTWMNEQNSEVRRDFWDEIAKTCTQNTKETKINTVFDIRGLFPQTHKHSLRDLWGSFAN